MVDGACRIVECSKNLIVNAKEPAQWQQLAQHTKGVSESIKRLATSVKYVDRSIDFDWNTKLLLQRNGTWTT